jgi:phosphoserine phosphatase
MQAPFSLGAKRAFCECQTAMAQNPKPRLVVLDIEGVLIPKNRFFFESSQNPRLHWAFKSALLGFLYEAGLIKLESALKRIYGHLRGVKVDTMLNIFGRIPAMAYLQRLCAQLKARNCKVAIISSGIPTVAVKKLAASNMRRLRLRRRSRRIRRPLNRRNLGRRHHQKRQTQNPLRYPKPTNTYCPKTA